VDEDPDRKELEARGLRLEYTTIAWNAIEMFISLGLGIAARSLALVAFGLDTMVELFASGVVVWHLHHPGRDNDHITAQALRMVAWAFFTLALVVVAGSVWALTAGSAAHESPIGIAYLAVTVVVMLSLGTAKRATGLRLGNEPLVAEARMSIVDAALALGILIGLAANVLFGWWWADSLAAVLVGAAAIHRESKTWKRQTNSRNVPASAPTAFNLCIPPHNGTYARVNSVT
jgi:divalent metal cation (Fe/Co/Zn/Cd) transporter